jgi:uncharacterized membrane protein
LASQGKAHPKWMPSALLLLFLCSSFLVQAPAPVQAVDPPPPSVTVTAGCTTATRVAFTNDVPQYVSANPTMPLDFRHGSYLPCPASSPTPADVPPIFFRRGTSFVIAVKCAACTFTASVMTLRPAPTVQTITPTRINDTAYTVSLPADAAIGLYQFTGDIIFHDCSTDSFTGNFWVIFNALPNSPDRQVTTGNRFSMAAFQAYVMGTTDYAFFGTMTGAGSVKDVRGVSRGGTVTFTLSPQRAVVYLKAMQLVDSAKAWKSANASVTAFALGTGDILPSGWPTTGKTFKTSWNIPDVLTELQDPTNNLCGQCMIFASIAGAFTRSIGVPNRMVTTINSLVGLKGVAGSWTWNFHVWDEVWLNQVTNRTWSAYDPSKGVAFGHTTVTPVKPSPRTAAAFADRFATGALPGAAAGACPCSSVALFWALTHSFADTTSYRDPLPDPSPTPSVVSVSFDKSNYTFGDDVHVAVTVKNPYSFAVHPSGNLTFAAESFGGINLEGPWPVVTTYWTSSDIPPDGSATATFLISESQYQSAADYVALASVDLGPSTAVGYNFTVINSGLLVQLGSPPQVNVSQEFDLTAKVMNELATPVSGTNVTLFLPDSMTAAAPTKFMIATLGAGQTATFTIPVQIDTVGLEVLSMEASAASAGVSNSAPTLVNATDPPSQPAVAMEVAGGGNDTTTSGSSVQADTITSTCSTTSTTTSASTPTTVPEFGLPVTLVVATVFVAVILLRRRELGSGGRTDVSAKAVR